METGCQCLRCVCFPLQVQYSSVLFVDNPVGTGFSYTDSEEAFATDVATVASDMLVLLKQFFNKEEEFQVGSGSHRLDHQWWVQNGVQLVIQWKRYCKDQLKNGVIMEAQRTIVYGRG